MQRLKPRHSEFSGPGTPLSHDSMHLLHAAKAPRQEKGELDSTRVALWPIAKSTKLTTRGETCL